VIRRVLVVSTVHHPDDNRIREKTIRSLASVFRVDFAAREPGPSDLSAVTWVPLRGGRLRRNLAAWRVVLTHPARLISLHDPELLPLGIFARVVLRRRVVFDMHEDVPAQMLTKPWLPRPTRAPVAALMRWLLRLAESTVTITLAEASYQHNLRRRHPVFSNYPDVASLPKAGPAGSGAVYVGDVTLERGLLDAVVACSRAGVALVVVGPVSEEIATILRDRAAEVGAAITFTGRVPHSVAMAEVAEARLALSPLHDHPNYRQSIPTKVLEYLAIGVPVVASDLPATRELVDGLEAVTLHPPGDVDAMAAAIATALQPEMPGLALAQADAIRQRYQWPADRLVEFYERLVP
jgi:glycosyltransferase involved in cell wall biosynthesis